jgi:hypothetical protein
MEEKMETKKVGMSPGNRLETGAIILAAAQVADTALIKPRLTAFTKTHRSYAEAQRDVGAAEDRLRSAQTQLMRGDAVQDEAVEALARVLLAEGQPRANPFVAYGAPTPWGIKRMWCMDEAKAIHNLVAAIQRNKAASEATLQAARAADEAALAVEKAVLSADHMQMALREARLYRNAIGHRWETDLAALKRAVRSAEDDGAPGLHAALFGRLARPTARAKTKAKTEATTTTETKADGETPADSAAAAKAT